MLWYVCLYSHLVIAFNRVIAIAFPLRAFAVLTVRKTYLIALICWMLGILHILPNFSTDSCYFLFDAVKWKFIFSKTSCGYIIFAINLYNVHAILILILLLDSTTSICLRIKHKVYVKMSPSEGDAKWKSAFSNSFIIVLFHFHFSHLRMKAPSTQRAMVVRNVKITHK
ncbi:hypothetical protein KIN20_007720 [Parelaphostrongylus tenuis]|uniref:G-protein coupled receptors family 1 profile domain-containing protein n=1 Tax=Parelaphostrongylus tenuis TaxID=148309 RepID=A0AAD5QH08_PARTN|nr:hypothetical protein KIN20_007720 [Parelaphostrongylus tenuis]